MYINFFCRTLLWLELVCLMGCDASRLRIKDFVQYVRNPENGLVQRAESAGFRYELQYEPPALAAFRQANQAGQPDPDLYRQAFQDASQFYNFQLVVRNKSAEALDKLLEEQAGSKEAFSSWQNELFFKIQNRFRLAVGPDTLPCTFYYTQPMGKIENAYNILLAFEAPVARPVPGENRQLVVLYDDHLFSRQRLAFPFSLQQMHSLPELIF